MEHKLLYNDNKIFVKKSGVLGVLSHLPFYLQNKQFK